MKLFTPAESLFAYNRNVPVRDAHPGMDESELGKLEAGHEAPRHEQVFR